jgi:hypothetical protein
MGEVYYGSITCQAIVKSTNKPCVNGAYYHDSDKYLCGVHSNKNTRTTLNKDKNKVEAQKAIIENHAHGIKKEGLITLHKMGMRKPVPLVPGYLNIFPNKNHQNRTDGFGCSELSPMNLGPVIHNQPGLPPSLNLENYHQHNKCLPRETTTDVDGKIAILPEFFATQLNAYNNPIPNRHKIKGEKPLFSLHLTTNGEQRRYDYVQSRYFYCKAYEILVRDKPDFKKLVEMRKSGTNMIICGYDAHAPHDNPYTGYQDESQPFGHEMVLYYLLTMGSPYPWDIYYQEHIGLYI